MAAKSSSVDCMWRRWKKVHTSAMVIIPPQSCWQQIQHIRSEHDKAYKRWMPHINLLYPFIENDATGRAFDEAEAAVKSALTDMESFKIHFNRHSFRTFRHGKSCTLWLKPDQQKSAQVTALNDYNDMHEAVLTLQRRLQTAFPECNDLSSIDDRGFTPHLSLGQFSPRDVDKFVETLRPTWNDVEFDVTSVCLISRQNFDDPFSIKRTVLLINRPD